MANMNMKTAVKWANHFNVNCQLIPGKSEKNCKAVIFNGETIKTSNMSSIDFENLFSELACKKYGNAMSVAKQMINDAHGRTDNERLSNFFNQDMTYADPFQNVQFAGRTLTDVLNQCISKNLYINCKALDYDVTCLKSWIESMKEWHGSNALNMIKSMITNKEIYVVDNHIITSYILKLFIDKWASENKQNEISDNRKTYMIETFLEKWQEV